MSSEESCLNSSDDQPKDLTIKTAKKLKPIPPPLNLTPEEIGKMSPSLLKEFAIAATSPKSPLMQKHLPFRKSHPAMQQQEAEEGRDARPRRAHSIPVNLKKPETEILIPTTVDEICDNVSSTSNESQSIASSPNVKFQSFDKSVPPSVVNSIGLPLPLMAHRSHTEMISNPDLSRNSFVLDLSTGTSSALLSPAPSSLGSSREELADPFRHKFMSWGYPWPPPIWHCFQPGSQVKVGGCWRPVEDMTSYPTDWPGELLVERITLSQITCCALSSCGEIVVDVTLCHPLLAKDRGWVALCPDSFHKRYGLKCLPLQLGDIVLRPTTPLRLPLPSPDICDRIKRFSFPTVEESPPSPAFLLSPPTTPTRKSQEVTDKPKRPMNAFMLFAKRYRLELIQTNPGKDNRAISVILGEAWRMLPQEERDKYIQGARDLSEEQKLLYPDCWKRKRSHSTS